MSYLVYINGSQIDTYANMSLPQTKQANDIANLTNRNANFTHTTKFPRTAKNIRIFQSVFNVGNNSNLPYEKATCEVIDIDSGQHLIYNGWAVLLESLEKDYSLAMYDGVIDFYREIENVTLTQAGLTELNHEKNIANVIATWTDPDLPYRYNLADYNGKNLTAGADVNIDYQIPSVKISFLWDKVFQYIDWVYTGTIFQHEKFQNLWLSYPKPVPTEAPVLHEVSVQDTEIISTQVLYPWEGGTFYGSSTSAYFFPDAAAFDPTYYNGNTGAILAGTYRIEFAPQTFTVQSNTATVTTGQITIYTYNVNTGEFSASYVLDITNGNYIDLSLVVGDKIIIVGPYGLSSPTNTSILTGTGGENTINYISGYSLGFDQAFIDYLMTDFVKEIMIRFGLTPFKDKYSNTIHFLTLTELLQNTNINNWSSKFNRKLSEKYTFGNYAKKNIFAYQYNDEGLKHNNGSLDINNAT